MTDAEATTKKDEALLLAQSLAEILTQLSQSGFECEFTMMSQSSQKLGDSTRKYVYFPSLEIRKLL